MIDKSWNKPFENSDTTKGPTGKLVDYTEQQGIPQRSLRIDMDPTNIM